MVHVDPIAPLELRLNRFAHVAQDRVPRGRRLTVGGRRKNPDHGQRGVLRVGVAAAAAARAAGLDAGGGGAGVAVGDVAIGDVTVGGDLLAEGGLFALFAVAVFVAEVVQGRKILQLVVELKILWKQEKGRKLVMYDC